MFYLEHAHASADMTMTLKTVWDAFRGIYGELLGVVGLPLLVATVLHGLVVCYRGRDDKLLNRGHVAIGLLSIPVTVSTRRFVLLDELRILQQAHRVTIL